VKAKGMKFAWVAWGVMGVTHDTRHTRNLTPAAWCTHMLVHRGFHGRVGGRLRDHGRALALHLLASFRVVPDGGVLVGLADAAAQPRAAADCLPVVYPLRTHGTHAAAARAQPPPPQSQL
jgi:hypothetical protein